MEAFLANMLQGKALSQSLTRFTIVGKTCFRGTLSSGPDYCGTASEPACQDCHLLARDCAIPSLRQVGSFRDWTFGRLGEADVTQSCRGLVGSRLQACNGECARASRRKASYSLIGLKLQVSRKGSLGSMVQKGTRSYVESSTPSWEFPGSWTTSHPTSGTYDARI